MTYTAIVRYQLPFPPSVNGYWRAVGGRQILSKRGREYRASVAAYMAERRVVRLLGALQVKIELWPPDRRIRDVDNYSKAVLDALTHAGAWNDDGQIFELKVIRHEKDGDACALVEILEVAK